MSHMPIANRVAILHGRNTKGILRDRAAAATKGEPSVRPTRAVGRSPSRPTAAGGARGKSCQETLDCLKEAEIEGKFASQGVSII